MTLQLSFDEGAFAGKTIRTTDDHFASAYDIMRVAGVGREPTNQWNAIKENIDQANRKIYKFKGAGQRDTPVVNGKGVVQMLFLLPGLKARKFVAEAAEILVRYLGGDESLVAELKVNREIAAADASSIQNFMRDSADATVGVINDEDKLIANDERRQNLRRLTMENDAQELTLLEQYKQYALANVVDPRIKERIQNDIVNRLISSLEQHTLSQPLLDAPKPRFYTIDEVATDHLHLRLTTTVKGIIGRAAAQRFKSDHPTLTVERTEKFVNGEMRQVRVYPALFLDTLKELIMRQISTA